MSNPLKLLYSPVTENFYVSRAKEKQTKEGKPYLFATGKKTEVTQDFFHCLIQWLGNPDSGWGFKREIISGPKKYTIEIRCEEEHSNENK